MVRFIVVFILLPLTLLNSQQRPITKDSLSISKEVAIYETLIHDSLSIHFSKVIQDSRCPKDVTCVRAGEADIELKIKEHGKEDINIICRIDASGYVSETNNLILETADAKVYAFALTPYPESSKPTEPNSYKLEVVFKPKTKN